MLFLQQNELKMEYFEELKQTKIFCSATEFECQAMMFCFKTRFKYFAKNQHIVEQGQDMDDIVLILKGGAIVQHIDSLGDISILTKLKKTDAYGFESAYAGDNVYKDSLIATEKTLVMFMNKHRILNPCENKCRRHDIVVKHIMQTMAQSHIELLEKLKHITKKTIREKLMSYFTSLAKNAGSNYFEIPFNKTELASYLAVDRSAMSAELSRMKDEGLIEFDRRQFRILKKDV